MRKSSRTLALVAAALIANAATNAIASPPGSGWSMLFDDEFNGNSLDSVKWSNAYPWSQHGLADDSVEEPANVSVGNGVMTFAAQYQPTSYGGSTYNYTSGAVNTNGKLNFTYGYIESRQQMPGQQGTWPAFWTLQNGWPPEIDIQEDPEFSWNETSYPVTYHYTPSGGGNPASAGTTVYTGINLAGSYNTYGVDWEPNSLAFYFNGQQVYTVNSSQANIAQMANEYLLIDMGVGGWPGEPPNGTPFPATMETDWVRVWQKNAPSQSSWTLAGNGSWDTSANWSAGPAALSGTIANFGAVSASSVSVSWTGSRTVGGLTFQTATNYILGSSGSAITLAAPSGPASDSAPGSATVNINGFYQGGQGSATINARLELENNVSINNFLNAPITLNGNIYGWGNLTFDDGGPANTYGGVIINGIDSHTGNTYVIGNAKLILNGAITSTTNFVVATGVAIVNSSGSIRSTGVCDVGSTSGTVGNLTLAGSLNDPSDFNVGDVSATGSLTLSGNLTVATLAVGKYGTSSGTVVQTGGSVKANPGGGDWIIGGYGATSDAAAVGIWNMSGGTFAAPANLMIGGFGTGTFIQSAGTVSSAYDTSIGRFSGGTGVYNISGGTLNASSGFELIVAEQGTGTLTVAGTAVVNSQLLSIARSDGGSATGTVVQTGGTVNATAGVVIGYAANGGGTVSGTYNLSGGTLITSSISQVAVAKLTGTMLFNGGTVQPTGSSNTFLGGLSKALVEPGGAVFNTSGFNITVSQNLQHDSSLGTTADGGLTKAGLGVLTLTGSSNYTGATQVKAGTLLIPAGASLGTSSVNISSGGQFNLSGSLSAVPSISDNGTFLVGSPAGPGVLVESLGAVTIGSLSAPGATASLAVAPVHANRLLLAVSQLNLYGSTGSWSGRLDLGNNDLDVQNGNFTNLFSQLQSGYSNGRWNGSGGITSLSASTDSTHLTALGVVQNSVNGLPTGTALYGTAGSLGLFDGTSPSNTDVLLKYTYYGDANLDGKVSSSDYTRIDAGYLNPALTGWFNGDFNYDGVVNGSDYTLIDNAFNAQGPSLSVTNQVANITDQIAAASAVPEPTSSIIVLAGITTNVLGRRRYRSNLRSH